MISYTILYQNFIFTHETGLKKNVVAPEYTRKHDFYIMIMCMYDYQLLSEIYKQNVHKFILCPHIKTKQNVKEGIPCLIGYE